MKMLLACAAVLSTATVWADLPAAIQDVVTAMAGALSEGNAVAFLQNFDASASEYGTIQRDVTALLAQSDVLSSIEFVRNEGDDAVQSAELDWFLEIRPKEGAGPLARRRTMVRCRFQRQGRKWKVVAFAPAEFLAPATN